MYVLSMSTDSSPRSNFAPVTADCFQGSNFARAGCSLSCSKSVMAAGMPLVIGALDRLRRVPVQHTFLPYIEEAHQHDSDVNHHLPKAEETGAGNFQKVTVDDCPGNKKDGFHVEEDEQHGNQIKF